MNFVSKLNDELGRVKPLFLVGISVTGTYLVLHLQNVIRRSDRPLHKRYGSNLIINTFCFLYFGLSAYFFSLLRYLPSISEKISRELNKTAKELERTIHSCDTDKEFVSKLAWEALDAKSIMERVERYQKMGGHYDYKKGRVSGAVYTDIDVEHMKLLTDVFSQFAYSNPLHPDVFPAIRKIEAEVIRMVADLLHGDSATCGTMTSGGTESIVLACLSSRNYARSQRGIHDPIVVVPTTAHAAFDKACSLMGIRIRHVPVDQKTGRVDIDAMRRSIDKSTCLLVGSAPNFPFGTFDDIPAIAKLGSEYGICVHVDACLGGFLIAFAEHSPALQHLPPFDFRVPGVTSISCDTHKYGYAPKGTSIVLYRTAELLHHQYFCVTEWPGGLYATPTLAGSRAGLNIALTWATLLHFGRKEYARRAHLISLKATQLADAIEKLPGIYVVGTPDVSIVAFSSNKFNIHAVGDHLNKLGWNLNFLQMPDSLHFCLTYNQTSDDVISAFLEDLKVACREVIALPDLGKSSKTAAIYGMSAQIPDKTLIEDIASMYLDACYSIPPAAV